MSTQNIAYGTDTAFGSASNLNSLANNAAKPLGAVDNSTALALNEKVKLKMTLASTGVSSTGTIEVYALASNDNTDWTDGISTSSTTDVSASLKNAQLLAILNANANSQVVDFNFDLIQQGGMNPLVDVPKYWALVVFNKSGAAIASSGNAATYTPITYTVA